MQDQATATTAERANGAGEAWHIKDYAYVCSIILTDRCNIRCGHCVFSCGPEKSTVLSTEKAVEALAEVKRLGLKGYHITGGEPILYLKQVIEIATEGYRLKLPWILGSNCFWGRKTKNAHRIVSRLRKLGMRELHVGYDEYHRQFISEECLVNALAACAAHDVRCKVQVNHDRHGHGKEIFERLSGEYPQMRITYQHPFLVGRSRGLDLNWERRRSPKSMNRKCRGKYAPAIMANGDFWGCCNFHDFDSRPHTPMVYGNLYQEPARDIFSRWAQSRLSRYLVERGPFGAACRLIAEGASDGRVELNNPCYSTCDACCDLFGRQGDRFRVEANSARCA